MTTTRLGTLDIVLLLATVTATCVIGYYYTDKPIETHRRRHVVPVAVSMLIPAASGLSFMGYSSELFYQGPSFAMTFISALLAGPLVACLILPVLRRSNALSPYSYLEKRYGPAVKHFVTPMQIVVTVGCNSVAIYLPSMALRSILGIDLQYSILIFGSACVLYSVSGLKAVLWTDVLLVGVMFSSLVVITAAGTYQAGGYEQVYQYVTEGGRLELDDFFSFDLTARHTFLGIVLGATIREVYIVGANQVFIQRACGLPSLRLGQVSYVLSSVLTALLVSLATYAGAVIYATFGPCDPYLGEDGPPRRDVVLLHYVANHLPFVPGIRGLFVSGIFLVSMTLVNSSANGMASLILKHYLRPPAAFQSTLSKTVTASLGYMCVLAAYAVDSAQSRLLQASITLSAAVGVPVVGAIALGIFTSFTNASGILAGLVVNLLLGLYVTFVQVFVDPPLEPTMAVHYDRECESILNMTSNAIATSRPDDRIVDDLLMIGDQLQFDFADMSYFMLPVVQFASMVLIASLVSLMTGGRRQTVSEDFVIDLFHRKQQELVIEPQPVPNKLWNQIMVATSQSDKTELNTIIGRSFKKDSTLK